VNPENTLLGLLTGGRYTQSSDLPTARQVGSSAIDSIIESDNKRKSKVLFESGKNIFGKPTKEFTQGDLDDLISGFAGTTKPIMSKLGLSKKVPRNPLYHITNMKNIKSILAEGILPKGGSASFTRDPNLKEVYGIGKKKVQLLVDKNQVEKYAGKKLSPYQYVGGRPEGKGGLRFEAEERLTGEGLGATLASFGYSTPSSFIKAIRLRDLDNFPRHPSVKFSREMKLKQDAELAELIKDATKKYIPIVTDKKYKKNIEKLIDKITSVSDKGYLKENIHYIGKNTAWWDK
tara:strand:+ start:61 stop:930 length:870 start_codon:yes stop_codon:yes gene_type:complete